MFCRDMIKLTFVIILLSQISKVFALNQGHILHHSCIQAKGSVSEQIPIIILHGLLGSSRNFQTWARLLHSKLDSQHDIICMDLRNHGRTANRGVLPMNYESMVSDLKETMDFLNIDKAHIIGHSMGGKVAAMASLDDKIKKKIVSTAMLDISPIHYSTEDFSSVNSAVEHLVFISSQFQTIDNKEKIYDLITNKFPEESFQQFVKSNLLLEENDFRWSFRIHPIAESLNEIISFPIPNDANSDKPTLIISGSESNFVRSSHVPLISKLFSKYTVATVKGAGHWVHIEKPQETVDKVVEFINWTKNN